MQNIQIKFKIVFLLRYKFVVNEWVQSFMVFVEALNHKKYTTNENRYTYL